MKIPRDTPDQLIVENNPIVLALILNGVLLAFLAIGLFLIGTAFGVGLTFILTALLFGVVFNIAFIRRNQCIFDRTTDLVELRRKSLLRYVRRTWALSDLSHAEVQTSYGGNRTYRAALVFTDGMDAGTVPLTHVYSSGTGAERACNAINGWLKTARD